MKITTLLCPFIRVAGGGLLVGLTACSSHPDSLRIDLLGAELVPSQRYVPSRAQGELALALTFKGSAPFAAIAKDNRIPQFNCELHDAAGTAVAEYDVGRVYLDGPTMSADAATGLVSMENGESYRYRAVTYFGLKSKTTVNGPYDLDLLHSNYDHVACRLRGSQMFATIWMSNDLVVSRRELQSLAAAGQGAR